MKITGISAQVRDANRVNVSVDGKYRFSLDIFQLGELGIKVGAEYSDQELRELEEESVFGKVYARSLEYALVRPRSVREMKDYLYKKTRDTRTKEGAVRKGVSINLTERVLQRLLDKGYVDDEKVARFWIENRQQRKGISTRKLTAELMQKGVSQSIIDVYMSETDRTDGDEIMKIIAKKQTRYPDEKKFMQYLARQGFSYDTIRQAIERSRYLAEDSDS